MNPDYQKSESSAVGAIKKAIPSSLKRDMVESSRGMFCELYKNPLFPNHFCACAIDGVGTKLIIASALKKFDTIGIDLVAMNANDIATLGQVSPFLFMNYFAAQSGMHAFAGEVMKGIVKGLEKCDASSIINNSIHINIGKGETASIEELLGGIKSGFGFDIAACMIGFIEKSKVPGPVSAGDKIIAFPSSGPHSNGYTDLRLALLRGDFEGRPEFRRRYRGRFSLDSDIGGKTIGEWLLAPTRIYLRDMAKISSKCSVMGINNTGYGLKNFNRIRQNVEFYIDDPLEPQPIFKLMQKESRLSDGEMYKRFNMGMGFFAVCKPEDAGFVLKSAKGSKIVGGVRKSQFTRTVLKLGNKEMVFS